MIWFHMQHLLINSVRVLICVHFLTNNLIVLSLLRVEIIVIIRNRILGRVKSDPNITSNDVTNEWYHVHTKMIECPNPNQFDLMKIFRSDSTINVAKHDSQNVPHPNWMYDIHDLNSRYSTWPSAICLKCGAWHFSHFCPCNEYKYSKFGNFANAVNPHPIIECQKRSIVFVYCQNLTPNVNASVYRFVVTAVLSLYN